MAIRREVELTTPQSILEHSVLNIFWVKDNF